MLRFLFLQAHERIITFACDEGYYPNLPKIPSYTVSCVNGTFPYIGNYFKCLLLCGDPPLSINGYITFTSNSYVTYDCMDGYRSESIGAVTCDNGSWSSDVGIECVMVCSEHPTPEGNYTQTPNSTLHQNGSVTIEYSCMSGYHPNVTFSQPHVLNCVDGNYTSASGPPSPLICVPDCGTPLAAPGARVVNSSHYAIEYACDSGYSHVTGSMLTACLDGEWEGTAPDCRRICAGTIPSLAMTVYTVSGPSHAIEVTYECVKGSHPMAGYKDPYVTTCVNGTYPDGLECEYDCDPPSGGNVTWSIDAYSANATCEALWTLAGRPSMQCVNGTWDSLAPVCRKECNDTSIPPISHANVSISGSTYDRTYSYTCHSG